MTKLLVPFRSTPIKSIRTTDYNKQETPTQQKFSTRDFRATGSLGTSQHTLYNRLCTIRRIERTKLKFGCSLSQCKAASSTDFLLTTEVISKMVRLARHRKMKRWKQTMNFTLKDRTELPNDMLERPDLKLY